MGNLGYLVRSSISGSSPIDNYVVDVLPYTPDGNSLDPVSIGRGDTGTAMLISGIDETLNHAVRVAAFNGGGGSDTRISPFSGLVWVEEPSTPTTTTAPPAATIGGSWDCDETYGGDWSCSGNVDKSDFLYEYWDCNQTYGGDWSCSGNVDKSDFGSEYWDCTQSYGGDWSCSGDGARIAIFSTPVPLAVS